jgi:hypothetical protein
MLNNIFTQIPALPAQGKYILRLSSPETRPNRAVGKGRLDGFVGANLYGRTRSKAALDGMAASAREIT